jgi:hypothetical protein
MPLPSCKSFELILTFQGVAKMILVSTSTSGRDLHKQTMEVFGLHLKNDIDLDSLKLLYKGKRINAVDDYLPFQHGIPANKKPKIMVIVSTHSAIQELVSKRSDPTIRGFEDEKKRELELKQQQQRKTLPWGENMVQNKNYKFCRFQSCTWHSFGHRPTDKTPHAFEAMQLLEKLASDPGVVAIMKERELVVGTLGEMDPIDDRLMQNMQQESGACLLGYNTNGGARIDIKLRSDDLQTFRPYHELVATLIHELSHNWVGEHNLLFWTNYAQMRSEYLCTHARLRSTIVHGKTTAELAGLDKSRLENIFEYIMTELVSEMRQHGLHPRMIEAPIRQRIRELEASSQDGHRLGESLETNNGGGSRVSDATASPRELALAAAERRAKEQHKKEDTTNR